MNVRRPPEAPDDLRRRPGRAFSSKYALELPPPVSGSFATLPRRRAAVAKKQAELRRQALVEVALERQIWVENAEKDRIARTIVRIARRMDGKRRAVIAREDAAFRAGAREAAVAIETCWRRHAAVERLAAVKAADRVLRVGAAVPRRARGRGAASAATGGAGRSRRRPILWRARLARRELRAHARAPRTRFITEGVIPPRPCRMLLARRELYGGSASSSGGAAPRRAAAATSSRRRGAAVAAVAVPPEGPAVRASPPARHRLRSDPCKPSRARPRDRRSARRSRSSRSQPRARVQARRSRSPRSVEPRRRAASGGGTATPDRRGHRSGQGPRRDAAQTRFRAARGGAGRDAGRRGAHRRLAAAAGLGAVVRGRGAAARGGTATARAAGDLEGRRPVAGAAGAAIQEAAPRGAAGDDPGQGLRAAAGDAPGPLVGPGRRARAGCRRGELPGGEGGGAPRDGHGAARRHGLCGNHNFTARSC